MIPLGIDRLSLRCRIGLLPSIDTCPGSIYHGDQTNAREKMGKESGQSRPGRDLCPAAGLRWPVVSGREQESGGSVADGIHKPRPSTPSGTHKPCSESRLAPAQIGD